MNQQTLEAIRSLEPIIVTIVIGISFIAIIITSNYNKKIKKSAKMLFVIDIISALLTLILGIITTLSGEPSPQMFLFTLILSLMAFMCSRDIKK